MRNSLLILMLLICSATLMSGCYRRSSTSEPQPAPTPSASHKTFPKQDGLINDYANVLDADARSRIQPILDALVRDLDVEFAVVTVETTGEQSAYDYSLALSREWKVGKGGKGLLYLLAIKDQKWRIQVGTGLEQALPNEVCAELHEPVLPLLKEGKYGDAVELYVSAIDKRLRAQK